MNTNPCPCVFPSPTEEEWVTLPGSNGRTALRMYVQPGPDGYVRLQQITEDRLVAQLFHGSGFEHVLGARGERAAVRVCGRPALRLHERTTASTATPSYMRDGQVVHGPPVTLPARETIQVRFEHHGEAFALVWSGPPAVLARYRALERAFFRSVRCV